MMHNNFADIRLEQILAQYRVVLEAASDRQQKAEILTRRQTGVAKLTRDIQELILPVAIELSCNEN